MFHLHFSKAKLLKNKIGDVYKFRFSSDPQIKTYASVCPQTTHRILSLAFFFFFSFLEAKETSKYADKQSFSILSNFSSILV